MLVDVPSPTGEEAPLARTICAALLESGLDGHEQKLDDQQSNATARIRGVGEGAALLLYSPIDTVTAGNETEDLPWVGDELRRDMQPESWVAGDIVFGLGAQNPKGHAASIFAAAEAIHRAGIPLLGDLVVGFGAGGMPTNARRGTRSDSGHGAGCVAMMRSLVRPDFAVIAKSGWAVSWEEVGLAWFEIRVPGTHTYVGSRHLLPYSNAIANGARVVERLERWFQQWAEEERSGLVLPQGMVGFFEAGWERMPAFSPATSRLLVDLRLSPRTTPDVAESRLREEISRIGQELELELEVRRVVAIPGTSTPEESWVIRCCKEAWEAIEKRPHQPLVGMSGATDANILRAHGVPTARIGLAKAELPDLDFQLGMNAVSIADIERLTNHLIGVAIETCTRTIAETGS
jgi:acetylornithine deacetylase/succinyl-diaminopimelate desuccinylase-like protein